MNRKKNLVDLGRRYFLKASVGVPALCITRPVFGERVSDPRFLLLIINPQGASTTEYLDARLPIWTDKGMLASFYGSSESSHLSVAGRRLLTAARDKVLSADREHLKLGDTKWTDGKGGALLARASARPLEDMRQELCIFNGVLSDPKGDGHDRNLGQVLTGNHQSQVGFFEAINSPDHPFSYIQFGDNPFIPFPSNSGSGLRFSSPSLFKMFASEMQNLEHFPLTEKALSYFRSDSLARGRTHLPFFAGVQKLLTSLANSQASYEKLKKPMRGAIASDNAPKEESSNNETLEEITIAKQHINILIESFKSRLTTTGILTSSLAFDAHSADTAVVQPANFFAVSHILKYAIETLKSTEFMGGSLYDRTTILMTSEFSRTLRQDSSDIYQSGTDHNTLCNTVVGAGRAFRNLRGRILGASDMQAMDEKRVDAHWALKKQGTRSESLSAGLLILTPCVPCPCRDRMRFSIPVSISITIIF